ncbi:ArnT family glycosyltransferase [Scandinavium goeteborgense]|uniref:Dolichyl-phosphate-mannose-protein mannosyltransferase n=1 Tax=Scandinavium goeteborgense TaxID=1851514 RepID=A0A4R6EWU6_SCAGO|nr:glycosyltransferase family 39 protein [Scandinavium goeteborgense]TDN64235.1 dolichyl-phosphate-mannose-protein mannosyltransferase [Scandinavium goeteborgense]
MNNSYINDTKVNFLLFVLLSIILIGLFQIFWNISVWPFADWDEGRHGVSAVEMMQSGNFVVNTYAGARDYWNLKPPLSFLPTTFVISIFGKSVATARLASGLFASILLVIIALVYGRRYNLNVAIAALSLIVGCTFIFFRHAFRTADADSLFLLTMTLSVLSLSLSRSALSLSFAALMVSIAWLTKSWHALSIGSAFIISYGYLLAERKLTPKHLYLPVITLLALPLIWLYFRAQYDGIQFVKKMVEYDLLHRSGSQIEGHISTPLMYIEQLKERFPMPAVVLAVLLPLSVFINGFKKTFSYDFVIIFTTMLITYSFYSVAQTRLYWYSYLSVILLCLSSAILVHKCHGVINNLATLACVVTMLYFSSQYYKNIKNSTLPDFYYQLKHVSYSGVKDLVINGKITQSERMAIMFMTDFDFRKIHNTPINKEYILMSDKSSLNTHSSCTVISTGAKFNFYKCY